MEEYLLCFFFFFLGNVVPLPDGIRSVALEFL